MARLIKEGTLLWSPQLANTTSHNVDSGDAPWTAVDDSIVWKRPSTGVGSVKLTVGAGTTTPTYNLRANITTITADQLHSVHMPLYRENPNGHAWAVDLYLRNTALTAGYKWSFPYPTVSQQPRVGIFATGLKTSPTSTIGAPTSTTPLTRLALYAYSAAGGAGTMYLGPVYMNWYTKPNIVFSFDDGPAGNYDYAYPYMAARGLVGSVAVNGGSIGGPPKMTAANLVELRDAGWSIHNHTWSHTNLALSTESVIRTAIERNQTWLQGLGLHASGDQCFVLPYGNNSVTIEQIVADYYPYSATAAEGAFNTWDGMPDPYLVFRINHDDPTTSASIIAAIDVAVAKGQTIVLYGHDVQPSPVAATYTLTSVFYPIVDYVAKLVKAGIADNTNLQDAIVGLDGRRRLR